MLSAFALLAEIRIVSLAPSLTENLFAIGAGPQIVGVDSYSNYPAAARAIPRIGALVGVSVERIVALHPTLVVGISYQAPVLNQLKRYGIRTAMNDDDSLSDLYTTIRQYGSSTHHEREAARVTQKMRNRIAGLARRAQRLPQRSSFAVIGTSPIYTAGKQTFITSLMSFANLRSIVGTASAPWPQYSAESLLIGAPETLVTSTGETLPNISPWASLPAVRNRCVFTITADALLRPGPRFVDALQELVEKRERSNGRC